MHACYFRDW